MYRARKLNERYVIMNDKPWMMNKYMAVLLVCFSACFFVESFHSYVVYVQTFLLEMILKFVS